MSDWFIDAEYAYLVRLIGLLVVFGVLWPSLCLLVVAGRAIAGRRAKCFAAMPRSRWGHTT